jgi:hypothetical protein
MEGIYVRFKETDNSIWIGTHKYGMVKSGPSSWSSASIRKLFTVGDAVNSFKTAVTPGLFILNQSESLYLRTCYSGGKLFNSST